MFESFSAEKQISKELLDTL